jgi:hypothetical protein
LTFGAFLNRPLAIELNCRLVLALAHKIVLRGVVHGAVGYLKRPNTEKGTASGQRSI